MAATAWLNDNQYRDYPFISRNNPLATTTQFTPPVGEVALFELPAAVIVDFGAIMDIDAEFVDGEDSIFLYSISQDAGVYAFTFRSTAPGTEFYELVFYREATAAVFSRSFAEASSITAVPMVQEPCIETTKWSGFLITADLSPLADLVPDGETRLVSPGLWQIEPAKIQNLAKAYVRSITLANSPRTLAAAAVGCDNSLSLALEDPIVIARCLTGDIQFKEGFNCGIRQDNNNNAILLGAGVGIGAGEPCEEIPRYEGETSPDGGQFLSGGPSCQEILRTINGISGPHITIIAGSGLRVVPSPDADNTLVIDRSLDNFARCHGMDENSSIFLGG